MVERRLKVAPFLLAQSETSVLQYKHCVDAGECSVPGGEGCHPDWNNPRNFQLPVNYVDWHQATRFCEWAGARLPSELEWEFAAQKESAGGSVSYGNEARSCEQLRKYGEDCQGCVNDNRRTVCFDYIGGSCDMGDNFHEWVADSSSTFSDTSPWSKRLLRVVRFGMGDRYDIHFGGILHGRKMADESKQNVDLGFRCAMKIY